jgi:hypothetical protein
VSAPEAVEPVLEALTLLQAALDGEIARATAHTTSLIELDADAALAYSQARMAFSTKVAALQLTLTGHVTEAARALGVGTFEPADLQAVHPALGARLVAALAALRRATGELQRRDALNHLLANRARACVTSWMRGYVGLPAAYDRRGVARALASLNTSAKVA